MLTMEGDARVSGESLGGLVMDDQAKRITTAMEDSLGADTRQSHDVAAVVKEVCGAHAECNCV